MIFFSNRKVSKEALLKAHYTQTAKRIRDNRSDYILCIQDSTVFNYTGHRAKTELGTIGKLNRIPQYGLIQHSTLCVTEKNEPLGLIDVQLFDYDDFDTSTHRHKRSVTEKASGRWLSSLTLSRSRMGNVSSQLVTIADREGDFFAYIHELIQRKERFVIRAKHDRYTGKKHHSRETKMRALLEKAPVFGQYKTMIQESKSRQVKPITLTLKAMEIQLPVPNKSRLEKNKAEYDSIRVNVVKAYDKDYEWILLTNLPIDSCKAIKRVVDFYRARWHIEDYHKVLKTGYQADEIYLHSSRRAIENLLALISISACRLYWLIYMGRVEGSIRADRLFNEFEWKCIYVYFKEPIPKTSPSLSTLILKIAKLGGYKPHKTKSPPGIKTLWIGFQRLMVASHMFQNTLSIKT